MSEGVRDGRWQSRSEYQLTDGTDQADHLFDAVDALFQAEPKGGFGLLASSHREGVSRTELNMLAIHNDSRPEDTFVAIGRNGPVLFVDGRMPVAHEVSVSAEYARRGTVRALATLSLREYECSRPRQPYAQTWYTVALRADSSLHEATVRHVDALQPGVREERDMVAYDFQEAIKVIDSIARFRHRRLGDFFNAALRDGEL